MLPSAWPTSCEAAHTHAQACQLGGARQGGCVTRCTRAHPVATTAHLLQRQQVGQDVVHRPIHGVHHRTSGGSCINNLPCRRTPDRRARHDPWPRHPHAHNCATQHYQDRCHTLPGRRWQRKRHDALLSQSDGRPAVPQCATRRNAVDLRHATQCGCRTRPHGLGTSIKAPHKSLLPPAPHLRDVSGPSLVARGGSTRTHTHTHAPAHARRCRGRAGCAAGVVHRKTCYTRGRYAPRWPWHANRRYWSVWGAWRPVLLLLLLLLLQIGCMHATHRGT
jgi:hypothetical protein